MRRHIVRRVEEGFVLCHDRLARHQDDLKCLFLTTHELIVASGAVVVCINKFLHCSVMSKFQFNLLI